MSTVSDAEQASGRPSYHRPVMLEEVVDFFRPIKEGVVVDATYGGGGHTVALLEELASGVCVLGIDRDPEAIARAKGHGRLRLLVGNFCDLDVILENLEIAEVAGVLFDFGMSGRQVETAHRGFSFRWDGPLDMRMGPDATVSADELVNRAPVGELAHLLRSLGEERFANRVARAIVAARPIPSTGHLAEVVKTAVPAAGRRTGGHPARRTFQALRMAVNNELGALSSGLDHAIRALRPGGRCVAIAYHSLEDRIVKHRFRKGEGRAPGPTLPIPPPVELKVLTRRPVRPRPQEVAENPRARSSRLRAAEKVA